MIYIENLLVSLKQPRGKLLVSKKPGVIFNLKEDDDGKMGMYGLRVYL